MEAVKRLGGHILKQRSRELAVALDERVSRVLSVCRKRDQRGPAIRRMRFAGHNPVSIKASINVVIVRGATWRASARTRWAQGRAAEAPTLCAPATRDRGVLLAWAAAPAGRKASFGLPPKPLGAGRSLICGSP